MDSDGKDSNNVRQHVVLADVVGESQVEEARGLDLAPVGPAGAVRHQVHSELSLGRLNSSVGRPGRHLRQISEWCQTDVGWVGGHLESLREQFEVVYEGLHGGLHLSPAGGDTLGVVCPHVSLRHLTRRWS